LIRFKQDDIDSAFTTAVFELNRGLEPTANINKTDAIKTPIKMKDDRWTLFIQ
jgi:hypothetical protein